MELEVRHLRVLTAIADNGSLHKAARELGMAQPSMSTQLRRIEQALGGQLFTRERTGCRPTPLGRIVLSRARTLVADMQTLVIESRAAAARVGGPQLRLGSTASVAIPGWLRRLRAGDFPSEPTLQMDVSGNALLRAVAAGQIDIAFVHEVEGSPLNIPPGLAVRELNHREPQFVSLSAEHPATAKRVIDLADLAKDRWMVDPTVDGEWDCLCRVLREAGLDPPLLHGDYMTAASLVAIGEVVTIIQPTAQARPGSAIRRLSGDPIGVRLLLAARTVAELEAVYGDLADAYWEAAWLAPEYRALLEEQDAALAEAEADGEGGTGAETGRAGSGPGGVRPPAPRVPRPAPAPDEATAGPTGVGAPGP